MDPITPEAVTVGLQRAWQRHYAQSLRVERLRPLSAGASASTWLLELRVDETSQKAVLQLYSGGENTVGALGKGEQARMQAAAAAAGIPTPEVLLVVGTDDGLPEGFLSRFTAGETLGKRIVHDPRFVAARAQLPSQCASVLARIHALESADFEFLPIRGPATQIEALAATHRSYGEALPVFEATLAWLRGHCPPDATPQVVHGDFRVGNFLVGEQGLVGVLDWELSHRGDPLEDLGWLCMRSWRFGGPAPVGGVGAREPFYRAYEQVSGRRVDPAAVRFWETLGTLKWGVICQWFAHRRLRGTLRTLEPAVIGRRVSEVEWQLLDLIEGLDA